MLDREMKRNQAQANLQCFFVMVVLSDNIRPCLS